jgi:hypothetical protein
VSGGLPPRLRAVLARRKWIVWVALLLALAVALEIGVELAPHSVRDSLVQYEEQSDGVRESHPNGVYQTPRGR